MRSFKVVASRDDVSTAILPSSPRSPLFSSPPSPVTTPPLLPPPPPQFPAPLSSHLPAAPLIAPHPPFTPHLLSPPPFPPPLTPTFPSRSTLLSLPAHPSFPFSLTPRFPSHSPPIFSHPPPIPHHLHPRSPVIFHPTHPSSSSPSPPLPPTHLSSPPHFPLTVPLPYRCKFSLPLIPCSFTYPPTFSRFRCLYLPSTSLPYLQ
ncbi:unnamed protein product [Closterium sp. Naga37s-1]|nr:unnamed protein product [Closterium sp. Naga37s-1]